MAARNYLIGQGERLVESIELKTGGGEKAYPYTFAEAREALAPMVREVARQLRDLPAEACPSDEAVVSLTLHPSFMAKTHFPSTLLRSLDLRLVGSRERLVEPRKRTKTQRRKELPAAELLVAGPRRSLEGFAAVIDNWLPAAGIQREFSRIEEIRALDVSRVKPIPGNEAVVPLEVVLHADADADTKSAAVLRGFSEWCARLGVTFDPARRRSVGGLSFVPLRARRDIVDRLADFSFVRAIRRMPKLRIEDGGLRGTVPATLPVSLPGQPALTAESRVAIFDGGLPTKNPLAPWADHLEVPAAGRPIPDCVAHGTAVTSALLFGPLPEKGPAGTPFSRVDHWRVIGSNQRNDDFELVDVLDRIVSVIRQRPYDVVVLSLGPDEAMVDDEVHVWTATLDQIGADGTTLIVSAAGNNGALDQLLQLNRVQPPSDGVNILGVGAADRLTAGKRATYSPVGPGRSPGLTKPDVLAFGGSDQQLFHVLDATKPTATVARMGTSFAAPMAGRLALGVRAHFGSQILSVTTKALLVHHAERGDNEAHEVGWGQLPEDIEDLVVCDDGEATIVYQGILEPARFMRFYIPEPVGGYKSRIGIRATFCFTTPVDPENSLNYTRTGLSITFRPVTTGHPGYNTDGSQKQAHVSRPFFGRASLFQPEQNLRDDARRWETVLRAERRFLPSTLSRPVFDVEHLARADGQGAPRSDNIPYALILTISASGEKDLYNRILRAYPGRLRAMQPVIDVPVRVSRR